MRAYLCYFLLVAIFQIVTSKASYAQVTISGPTLTFGACSFPSNYHQLENIIIIENARDDFSAAGTNPKSLELSAPSDFEFRPGTGFATVNSGGNLVIISYNCTAAIITIEYACTQEDRNDKMTIIGLELRAVNGASTGNITRSGGTGIINGLNTGETLTTTISSTDQSGFPNRYSTVSYKSGYLSWSDVATWECGVIPPNDGSAEILVNAYQGAYSTNNCLIFDQNTNVSSVEIEENANLSPGTSGDKTLTIQNDFTIQSNGSVRNIDWSQNGTNTIQIGGDFLNNGFMSTDGANNSYNLEIEMNGSSPQLISGTGSFRMIGSGTGTSTFTISAGADVTMDATYRSNDDNGTPGTVVIDGTLRFSDESDVINGLGNLVLNGYTELKASAFNDHYELIGTKVINTSTSTIEFTNSISSISISNIPSPVIGSLVNNVSSSGTLNILDNIVVSETLTMQTGNIITSSNTISIGSSISNIGSLNYQSGFIEGILKRWFTGTNSGPSSGLYPISNNGINKRFVTIEYTEATDGGSLKNEWINTEMGYNLNGDTITTNCNGAFLIENTDNGYWEITPNDGITTSENKAYSITLEGEGILSLVDNCHVTILKRVGSNPWSAPGTHIDNTGDQVNPLVKRTNVKGWSNWGFAGGPGDPLPVELSSFNTICNDESILINWVTQSEHNSSHFELMKSRDGFTWELIQNESAAGYSTSEITYSYLDQSFQDCYYKLVQYDIDGESETYGPIHSGCNSQNSYITTHPNPSSESFNLIINDSKFFGETQVEYYDAQGKTVKHDIINLKDGINLFVINSSELKQGVYMIRIKNRNNEKVLKHIVH
jgi:hypothetical protein